MSAKILLVDDDPTVLDAYARLLARQFDVTTASSAWEALKRIHQDGPFGVIVTDYEMPGESGIDLLRVVRESWPETVGMMLTGSEDRGVAIEAFEGGGVLRFLEKPVRYEMFERVIEEALIEHARAIARVEEAGRLTFSRDSLLGFVTKLEGRIDHQAHTLERLRVFVAELARTDDLASMARLAATAASDLLPGRGLLVELLDVEDVGDCYQAVAGPELGDMRLREEIRSGEGAIGSLQVNHQDCLGRSLSDADRHALSSLASSTAVAVHNQIRRRERDGAQLATILALASLAEHRDNETGKHIERVSRYCELIACGLRGRGLHADRITDDWIKELYRSAPLHDIGKVGIPDRILLKPGKLDPDEWEVMMTHTTIGADTLRNVMQGQRRSAFLQMSLDIAWCHHEKWDGSGYPRALQGEEIPLAARIVALADVYDALTTVRPYKQAWKHADARALILEGSGQHFDPDCVDAFLDCEERANEIRSLLRDEPG